MTRCFTSGYFVSEACGASRVYEQTFHDEMGFLLFIASAPVELHVSHAFNRDFNTLTKLSLKYHFSVLIPLLFTDLSVKHPARFSRQYERSELRAFSFGLKLQTKPVCLFWPPSSCPASFLLQDRVLVRGQMDGSDSALDARPWRPCPIRPGEEPHAERRLSDGRSSDTEKKRERTDAQTRRRIQQRDSS